MKQEVSTLEVPVQDLSTGQPQATFNRPAWNLAAYAIYSIALIVSISVWFLAIRAPLWLDETGSFWIIHNGFWQIASREGGLSFPAYSYILWFSTKLIGTSVIALRIPSVLAMLGAVYLLYLAARELFGREIAIIAAIIFSLNPIVVYASIDVRPYAFAALTINAAILVLLRLRKSDSLLLAGALGLLAAFIVYFHFLFAVILPALLLCFIAFKWGQRRAMWKQLTVALPVFVLAFIPLLPGLYYMFHTAKSHVYEQAPHIVDLIWTFGSGWWLLPAFILTALVAAAITRTNEQVHIPRLQVLLCLSLALIPILILYGVSAATPIHMFAPRHRLVAVSGIALCWAMLLSPFRSRALRLLFCLLLVTLTTVSAFRSPSSYQYYYTWKYALEAAEHNAAADNAPVLICSDFPESNYIKMPLGTAKESRYFSQLSYYKLSVPVVPLPRALNHEAIRVGSHFLQEAKYKHERFLAVAFIPSYPTLNWIARNASGAYSSRTLGVYDGIKVLEFIPRSDAARR